MEPKILSKQISSFSFHIKEDFKQVKADVETQVRYGTPINTDDNSALMSIRIDFHADNPDDFRIFIEEHIIFEFSDRPDNFESELEKLFHTTGLSIVSDDLDRALNGINKPPILIKNSAPQSVVTTED